MTRVVAAITDDSAARAVLSTSRAIASLFSATVEALHVGEQRAAVASAAREAGVTLRTIAGGAVEEIAKVAAAEDVAAVVIGARGTPAGKRPAGATTMALLTLVEKPVTVVPPAAAAQRPIRSVLLAMDGSVASAAALQEIAKLASDAELEMVVAHVLQERSLPAFSDQLAHEVPAWSEELIARRCPAALDARLELRVGEPHEHILDICQSSACDLVALGWGQDLGRGHAAVVRRILAESAVPVLLAPASRQAFSPRFAERRNAQERTQSHAAPDSAEALQP
jgi:nucleotide-binding universal stress UspA family protein